ncbi:hypothetical protein KCU78_g6539, partial [Aureobasidium melanogenum]
MAISIRNQSLELVDLPTEVLVEIFDHLPDKDLSTVRLVCKKLCDAATPRFAKVYFTERFHVVSPYSIDALIKITEHPIFGDFVKTVAICGARRIDLPERPTRFESSIIDETDQNAYLDGHKNTGRFARRMERVFGNVRSRSGSVTITIFDLTVFTEDFDQNLWSEHIQTISDLPGLEHCRLSHLRYRFSRALELPFGQHIFLPSHGHYPCQQDTFYLTCRDASDSIEINGNDVCDKLKELACYVAAAEVQKVQAIVSAGRVNDFKVGIIDQVPD